MRETEMSPLNTPAIVIDQAIPDVKEFRKANDAVTVRVRTGPTLSLMGRRLFNVLVYHAQRFGRPGVDAPVPFDTCPNTEDYFWIALPEIVQDSSWGSKDHMLVIAVLQQLQATLVESDSKTRFSSVQLLGAVHVLKGSGRRPTLVGWEFPRSTRDILSNPDIYTKLSIHHLTSLSTVGGTALYEIGKRYLTNPGGKTARHHWQWWYDTLTGKQIGSVTYPEYRYFKRDTLTPAIEEVNRTDIHVELVEFKSGRAVDELQFTIQPARQASLELPIGPVIDSAVIARLTALGFTDRQAGDIVCAHESGYLRATLDFVELRIADKKLEAVKSPAAFMRKALKDDYVASVKSKPTFPPTGVSEHNAGAPKETLTPADLQRAANIEAALKKFDAIAADERAKVLEVFLHLSPTLRRLKSDGVAFRKILGNWLVANELRCSTSLLG